MASAITDYSQEATDEARALAERTTQSPASTSQRGMILSAVGVAAAAAIVTAGIYYGPDFIRYLKIRSM